MIPLIAVVPFNSKDSAQAARMLDWCADLSGQQDATCILGYEPEVPAEAVRRAAARAFKVVEHLPMKSSFDDWPGSANDYFAITANAMRGRMPWLWLEADCVPRKPQWFVSLAMEFEKVQKGCMGSVIPQFFVKNGVYTQLGEMLAGVAVYHPNVWDHSPLLRCLRQTGAAYAAAKKPPRAFDSYLAGELLPITAPTPLIQHMGRSREFRREGDRVVCTYAAGSKWSPVLESETVLVHGCKDSSLIDLLRAEMNRPVSVAATVSVPPPIKTIAAPALKPRQPAWGSPDAVSPEVNNFAPVRAVEREITTPKSLPDRVMIPPDEKEPMPEANPVDPVTEKLLTKAQFEIEHWPECKDHTFTLQKNKHERYRVTCQCGAMSGKLPEGVDWELAWEAKATVDETANKAQDDSASGEMVSIQSHKLDSARSIRAPGTNLEDQPGGAGASPAEFAGSRGVKKHPESPGAEEQKPAINSIFVYLKEDTVVHYEDGTTQTVRCDKVCLPGELFPKLAKNKRLAPPKKTNPKRAKKPRTAAEQAKINARMAAMRSRRKFAKA